MPSPVKRFIYVPRDDLCNYGEGGEGGAVEVYEMRNAAFPKHVGSYFDISHEDMCGVPGIYRRHAIRILEKELKIRTTKEGELSSKNIDLRCLGD